MNAIQSNWPEKQAKTKQVNWPKNSNKIPKTQQLTVPEVNGLNLKTSQFH